MSLLFFSFVIPSPLLNSKISSSFFFCPEASYAFLLIQDKLVLFNLLFSYSQTHCHRCDSGAGLQSWFTIPSMASTYCFLFVYNSFFWLVFASSTAGKLWEVFLFFSSESFDFISKSSLSFISDLNKWLLGKVTI